MARSLNRPSSGSGCCRWFAETILPDLLGKAPGLLDPCVKPSSTFKEMGLHTHRIIGQPAEDLKHLGNPSMSGRAGMNHQPGAIQNLDGFLIGRLLIAFLIQGGSKCLDNPCCLLVGSGLRGWSLSQTAIWGLTKVNTTGFERVPDVVAGSVTGSFGGRDDDSRGVEAVIDFGATSGNGNFQARRRVISWMGRLTQRGRGHIGTLVAEGVPIDPQRHLSFLCKPFSTA